jgi:hypothetical protein
MIAPEGSWTERSISPEEVWAARAAVNASSAKARRLKWDMAKISQIGISARDRLILTRLVRWLHRIDGVEVRSKVSVVHKLRHAIEAANQDGDPLSAHGDFIPFGTRPDAERYRGRYSDAESIATA